jgi:hypothetical protein
MDNVNDCELWMQNWTLEKFSRTAVHISGLVAMVTFSDVENYTNKISIENIDGVNMEQWYLPDLVGQIKHIVLSGAL